MQQLLIRVTDNIVSSYEEVKKDYNNKLRVARLEKSYVSVALREAMKSIQKFQDSEMAQELRLKNTFETLRQLDIEILEFNNMKELQETEIPKFTDNNDKYTKKREEAVRNLKILESDLFNIVFHIRKDLESSMENGEMGAMDGNHLHEQVNLTIQKSFATLQ